MTSCAIKVCRNYRGRFKMNNEVTFHQIPSDPILKCRWVKIIQKSRGDDLWTPSKTTGICSDHFYKHEFLKTQKRRRLKKGAVPRKALYLSSVKSDNSTNSEETNTLQELNPVTTECQTSENENENVVQTNCIANSTGDLAENVQDFSDLDFVFDSPKKVKLRKDLRGKIILQKKHTLKIQSLRRKNLRLKKKVASFKTILETLRKDRYINNDTHDVLRSNVFAADLYSTMIKRLQGKCKRPKSKNTPDFRKFCLTLHFLSPNAFGYVRRKFETCLPHPKTISKWYANIDGSPGLTADAFQILEAKRKQYDKNLTCALIADEMVIRQQKCFNQKTRQVKVQ